MIKNIVLNNKEVFPIGLGTYGFGEDALMGKGISDADQVEIIKYSFKKGVNYAVGYLTYANGKAVQLLSEAIKQIPQLPYITFCAYPHDYVSLEVMKEKFFDFLKLMSVEKVDTFMVSSQMEGRFGRQPLQNFMNEIVESGYADTLGLNNFNMEQLNAYYGKFENKIVLHELCHNFEIRVFEDLKIIQRNKELGIQTITYQPLRRNKTAQRNWPLLVSLAEKYGKTQNQIILNWLYKLGILIMLKSGDKNHIDENIDALGFEMTESDFNSINDFKIEWQIPKLDWLNFNSTDGLYIAKLSNVFDEIYTSN